MVKAPAIGQCSIRATNCGGIVQVITKSRILGIKGCSAPASMAGTQLG
jgi:hypothetical protein